MNILSECSSAKKPKLENDNCFEKDNFIEESSFLCNIADELLACQIRLIHDLNYLHFTDPVSHVYNPLTYAFEPYSIYVKKYCTTTKHVLFIGMNPGPFGMAQTGVPFGEVSFVKEWLGIEGTVGKPIHEHPKREILGFGCHRSEISGKRFWNFFKNLCGEPTNFFKHAFVHNYCPLLFMKTSGKNVTPADLPRSQREQLQHICDIHIHEILKLLKVKLVICIGKYAYERILCQRNCWFPEVQVEYIMHPSPINPKANSGWNDAVLKKLQDLNVLSYFRTD